jgi:hypothetical protein
VVRSRVWEEASGLTQYRVNADIDYYPPGVDASDPLAERVHAAEGSIVDDLDEEAAAGLMVYGLVEVVPQPKVKGKESKAEAKEEGEK